MSDDTNTLPNDSAFPSDEELTRRLADVRAVLLADLPRQRRWWRRRRVVVAVTGVAGLALAASALMVRQATPEQVLHTVVCYEEASTDSRTGTGYSAVATPTDGSGPAEQPEVDPLESCGVAWSGGLMGQPTPPADPNFAQYPIPELFVCKGTNGIPWVFPRSEGAAGKNQTCEAMHLDPWDD